MKTRAYVSSSYGDLIEYRDAARRLLSQQHFEYRGMGNYDYVADPSLCEKCVSDAAAADVLILIVGYRYGTPRTQHEGKSLVELEYEAARNASRPVLAFIFTGTRLSDNDERRERDGGASIERFRRRLVDDGLLVSFFSDLGSFEAACEKALLAFRTKLIEQIEMELQSNRGDGVEFFIRRYLQAVVEQHKALDGFHVPLAANTTSSPRRAAWQEPAFGGGSADEESDLAVPHRELTLNDVADALDVHRQFYLVAEPGGGKSLSLMSLELAAARRYLIDPCSRFPLRVDISAWPKEQDFETSLWAELKERTGLAALPPAHLLLLIDGVIDSAAVSHDRLEQIEAWLARHVGCKAVLAVRTQRSFASRLPLVRISRLDGRRVRTFIEKRLGESNAASLLSRLGFDTSGKADDRHVTPLVRNPFNLSLICELEVKQQLPPNRVALMRAVVAKKHARETRHARRPALDVFVDALGSVAINMIRRRAKLSADRTWLRKVMSVRGEDVEEILSLAKDCGVMVGDSARDRHEFSHRLFLEYFAADYLRTHRGLLEEILEEPRYERGQRISRPFDEVVQTLVQLDDDPEIIETISSYDPFLAATCLPLLSGDDDKRSRSELAVVTSLGALLSDPHISGEAIAMLAQIGPPSVIVLRRLLRDSRHFIRRRAVAALAQICDPQAVEAVLIALCDPNSWVRADVKGAIRRFDQPLKELLLSCISNRVDSWRADPKMQQIDAALEELIDHVQADFGEAIAKAAGIELETADESSRELIALAVALVEATTEKPRELPPPVVEEEDDEHAAPEEPDVSWGFRWLADWDSDRGNPELVTSGKAWLRVTSARDRGWAFVWRALWKASAGTDQDLEWLARDWLERVPKTAGPWALVWRPLFKMRPGEALASRGEDWLSSVAPAQTGWNHVWEALWTADRTREGLLRLGLWWLHEVDADADDWSIIWTTLWAARLDRPRLMAIGREWVTKARPAHESWGFVWPTLWSEAPGDEALAKTGEWWLEHAPAEHPAWAYMWLPLRNARPTDARIERRGREWLERASPGHGGWTHVWRPLWDSNQGNAELAELGRTWLASARLTHHCWSHVWSGLWEWLKGDPQLVAAAREWLKLAPVHEGSATVCKRLLEWSPANAELLAAARDAILQVLPLEGAAFSILWHAQWDFGGEREWLGPLGREWLEVHGRDHRGFAFVWERLWADHPGDAQLRRLAIDWLRSHTHDRKWPFVAEPYAETAPDCPELLAIAKAVVEGSEGAANWPAAWRILADVLPHADELFRRGAGFVDTYPPTRKGWPRVWCRLPIKSDLSRGWFLMEPQFYDRRSWPDVWEVLWTGDPAQRRQLAELAADWLMEVGERRAQRITRWVEVMPLLRVDDEKRRDAVTRVLRIQRLFRM